MKWLILKAQMLFTYIYHEYQPKVTSLYMIHSPIEISKNTYYKHTSIKPSSITRSIHTKIDYNISYTETASSQDVFENGVTNKTYTVTQVTNIIYE